MISGILGLLLVVFIVFKILAIGVIATWSWWLVLIPLWIAIGVWVLIIAVAAIAAVITGSKV